MLNTHLLFSIMLLFFSLTSCNEPGFYISYTQDPSSLTLNTSPTSSSLASTVQGYGKTTLNVMGVSSQLSDGKILFTHDGKVTLYDPLADSGNGAVKEMNRLLLKRSEHTATVLPDNKVLIIGGHYWDNNLSEHVYTDSVEIYDPSANGGNGSSIFLTSLPESRYVHIAPLLSNGKVLIMGGYKSPSLGSNKTVYLYDPSGAGSYTALNNSAGVFNSRTSIVTIGNIVYSIVGNNIYSYDPDIANGTEASNQYTLLENYYCSATALSNGKILIVGGANGTLTGQTHVLLYDPSANGGTGAAAQLNPIQFARHQNQLIPLSNGKVLVVGGMSQNGTGAVNEVELYDPSGAGSTTVLTSIGRNFLTMFSLFQLSNGNIAIVDNGGGNAIPLVYNPTGNGSVIQGTTPSLANAKSYHSTVRLTSGDVLIIGGQSNNGTTNEIQRFSAVSPGLAFTTLTPLGKHRTNHTSTLLSNGKILVVGGYDPNEGALDSVELYDPNANNGLGSTISLTPLNLGRYGHSASLVAGDKVLIVSGTDLNFTKTNTVELYDPSANNGNGGSTTLNNLGIPGTDYHQLIPFGNKVIIAGGWSDTGASDHVVLYDYQANAGAGGATSLTPLNFPRGEMGATLLSNNKILFTGGYDDNGPIAKVELYDPMANGGTGSTTNLTDLSIAKAGFTANLMSDGKVLIVGGYDDDTTFKDIEIYDPSGIGSSQILSTKLKEQRGYGHTVTELNNGKFFIFGGAMDYGQSESWDIYTRFTPVQLSVTGGTAPYTYSVNIGTGRIENDYYIPSEVGSSMITVTDANGKTATTTIFTY